MLTACVAVATLASCEKEDIVPQVQNTRMKSVEVSLKNAVVTRGAAGDKIQANDPITVNNLKIFLTDAAGNLYDDAKTEDGAQAAKYYWTKEELANGIPEAKFHYVDPNCTKVVAVANCGDIDYADLASINIDDEQNAKELSLYAFDDILEEVGQHSDVNKDGTTYLSNAYKAQLMLKPRISRLEVDGFRVQFNPQNPKYETIKVLDLAFQNYYPTTELATGVVSGNLVNHMPDLANQTSVYNWFNDNTKQAAWYWDSFASLSDITKENPAADIKDAEGKKAPLAYHFFPADDAPVIVIRLVADGQPAYLYSKKFKQSNGTDITSFKEGKIYRMVAAGEDPGSDGAIPIDEKDIDPMDRCLDITVTVQNWTVDLVFPEF